MAAEFCDIGGKRFYWDGRLYATPGEAQMVAAQYQADGFEVELLETDEGNLVYSRREALNTS